MQGGAKHTPGRSSPPAPALDPAVAGRRPVPEFRAAVLFATREQRIEALVILTVILVGLGVWAYQGVRDSLRSLRANGLQTLLEVKLTGFEVWAEDHRLEVERLASSAPVQAAARRLLASSDAAAGATLRAALAAAVEAQLDLRPVAAVALIDREGRLLAAGVPQLAGTRIGATARIDLAPVFDGRGRFVPPRSDEPWMLRSQRDGGVHSILWFFAPLRDASGRIVAVLGLGRFAERRFARILGNAPLGETGEVYAFDREGWQLSESRFSGEPSHTPLLERDPGGRQRVRLRERAPGADARAAPLARLAQAALGARGRSDPADLAGVLLDPHYGYRGVEVIGAWRWLPGYDIGLAIEISAEEAYAPLRYLTTAYWVIFALLLLAAGIALASSLSVIGFRRQQRRLGPYRLQERIGEGGMSHVYRAVHALLKRPTAVKILKASIATDEVVARFEREVRLASRLSNPSTIEIYDYGRTRDGAFYYAMELLHGLTLQALVERHGPQPPGRVAHILRRMCESLAEAHAKGLVHRDIKPQNVMLCVHGGESDVVKVLDFGLVKELRPSDERDLTRHARVLGTPAWMAPERIEDPAAADPRADLYAVGAVGYFLLTGRRPFEADNDLDLAERVLHDPPPDLAAAAPAPVPDELREVIDACLRKSAEARPQRADDVLELLERLPREWRWHRRDARAWWADYQAAQGLSG